MVYITVQLNIEKLIKQTMPTTKKHVSQNWKNNILWKQNDRETQKMFNQSEDINFSPDTTSLSNSTQFSVVSFLTL